MSADLRDWKKSKRFAHVFGGFDDDQPKSLYRYMPLVQLISTLETGALALLDPRTWPDKAEAGWINKLFGDNAPLEGVRVRAACFTRESYSEALWHVYARMSPVVRVRLTLKDIVGACGALTAPKGKIYLGDVRYRDSSQMREAFQDVGKAKKATSREAASLLHLKRRAFSYEREVRLLWLSRENADEVVRVPLEFRSISQVLVSPYADDWVLKAIEDLVLKRYKLKCEVSRSTLDRAPAWMAS